MPKQFLNFTALAPGDHYHLYPVGMVGDAGVKAIGLKPVETVNQPFSANTTNFNLTAGGSGSVGIVGGVLKVLSGANEYIGANLDTDWSSSKLVYLTTEFRITSGVHGFQCVGPDKTLAGPPSIYDAEMPCFFGYGAFLQGISITSYGDVTAWDLDEHGVNLWSGNWYKGEWVIDYANDTIYTILDNELVLASSIIGFGAGIPNRGFQFASYSNGAWIEARNFVWSEGVTDTSPELPILSVDYGAGREGRWDVSTIDIPINLSVFDNPTAVQFKIPTHDDTWRTLAQWLALGAGTWTSWAQVQSIYARVVSAGSYPGSMSDGYIDDEFRQTAPEIEIYSCYTMDTSGNRKTFFSPDEDGELVGSVESEKALTIDFTVQMYTSGDAVVSTLCNVSDYALPAGTTSFETIAGAALEFTTPDLLDKAYHFKITIASAELDDFLTFYEMANVWVTTIDHAEEDDVRNGIDYDHGNKTGNLVLPSENDVEDGTGYGTDGTEFVGNFVAPAVGDVESGIGYGSDGVEFVGTFVAPAVGDVESGIGYGSDGVEFVGTFVAPAVGDVETGVGFGEDGTEFVGTFASPPSVGDVEAGVGYGEDGVEFVGTFEKPAIGDVEAGVGFGEDGTEFVGTFAVPAVGDVEEGVAYGAGGSEFTGTLKEKPQIDIDLETD